MLILSCEIDLVRYILLRCRVIKNNTECSQGNGVDNNIRIADLASMEEIIKHQRWSIKYKHTHGMLNKNNTDN
jgi:hypothetical protein